MWKIFNEHKIWFLTPFLTIIIYGGILIGFSWPISEFSISKSGQFGDSFGILNSLFSGLAFISLIITIRIQQKEMQDTKDSILTQNFENSFFKLFENHNKLLPDVIKYIEDQDLIKAIYYEEDRNNFKNFVTLDLKKYFMTFFQLLKFIDEQNIKFKNNQYFNGKLYIDMLKINLDNRILTILFVYCLVYDLKKYKKLLEEYNFLEYFDIEYYQFEHYKDRIYEDLEKYETKIFGDNSKLKTIMIQKKLGHK